MFGLIYLRLKYDQQGVMDMNGYIFLCICNNGFSTMFFVVNVSNLYFRYNLFELINKPFSFIKTFPLEIPIFMRDHQNGMYRVLAYYVAKIFTDVFVIFIYA